MQDTIHVRGARVNNLKNVSLEIRATSWSC